MRRLLADKRSQGCVLLALSYFCGYRVGADSIRLSACFLIASSMGRSPVVVLREA
jgi:hypothetical protein